MASIDRQGFFLLVFVILNSMKSAASLFFTDFITKFYSSNIVGCKSRCKQSNNLCHFILFDRKMQIEKMLLTDCVIFLQSFTDCRCVSRFIKMNLTWVLTTSIILPALATDLTYENIVCKAEKLRVNMTCQLKLEFFNRQPI